MTALNKQAHQTENERMAQSLAERNGEPVEGLRQRISELEEIATDYGIKFQKAQDALKHQSLLHKSQIEAAENNLIDSECHVAELEESLRDKQALLESAEKRIAELESNEIREDGNQFLVVRHPGKTPAIKHCSGDLEEFLRQLIEQDPLVTIDIITHRHYGVGGQWVQDGDEYLHMMTAAGIGVKGE